MTVFGTVKNASFWNATTFETFGEIRNLLAVHSITPTPKTMDPSCSELSVNRSTVCRIAVGLVGLLILFWTCNYLQEHEYLHFVSSSAVIGGLLSGSLHALTGSDHLAALLPLIFGKRWLTGCFYGLIWGLGHGFTSSAIGLASYSMKSVLLQNMKLFEMYGFVVDGAVGLTLMIIGVVGYYESLAEGHESNDDKEEITTTISTASSSTTDFTSDSMDTESQDITSSNLEGSSVKSRGSSKSQPSYYRSLATTTTVFVNGSVMGVS